MRRWVRCALGRRALFELHRAHRAFDDHILGPVKVDRTARILDLGSGAGDLTANSPTLRLTAPCSASMPRTPSSRRQGHDSSTPKTSSSLDFVHKS